MRTTRPRIYMREGDKISVLRKTSGDDIRVALCLKNYNESTGGNYNANTHYVSNGLNLIEANREGLMYVEYFTQSFNCESKTTFAFANVAGYFDNQIHTKRLVTYFKCKQIRIYGRGR